MRLGLRRSLAPGALTPLHPQWLVSRIRTARDWWVCQFVAGYMRHVGSADGSVSPSPLAYTSLDHPPSAQALYGVRPEAISDARRPPNVGEVSDTVLLLDVIDCIDDPFPALLKSAKLLTSGGQLLLAVPFVYPSHDIPFDCRRLTEFGLCRLSARSGPQVEELVDGGNSIAVARLSRSQDLSQAAIDGLVKHSWRTVLLPILVAPVSAANLLGWVAGRLFPSEGFLPGAYFVRARKRGSA